MPLINEPTVSKPIGIHGATNWSIGGNLVVSSDEIGVVHVHPGKDGRGAVCRSASGTLRTVLVRNEALVVSATGDLRRLSSEFIFSSPIDSLSDVHTVFHDLLNNEFWVHGQRGDEPVILALGDGAVFENPNLWTDRSGDVGVIDGRAMMMRRPIDSTFLYYALINDNTNQGVIMRGTGRSSPFTNITVTPYTTSVVSPTAYGVNNDGSVQMIFLDDDTRARSLDGGVNWSSFNIGTGTGVQDVTDIVYSKAFNRWVVAGRPGVVSSPSGLWYSNDNGANWARCRIASMNTDLSTSNFQTDDWFTHIEPIDPEGKWLLGVGNYAPLNLWISEDGGASWSFLQNLLPPYYDTEAVPDIPKVALINTGTNILLYQGSQDGWNYDNVYYASGQHRRVRVGP